MSERSEEGRNLPGRSNFQAAIVITISVVEAYRMFISLHLNYFSVPPLLNVPRNILHSKNKAKKSIFCQRTITGYMFTSAAPNGKRAAIG